jgi:hypothetical protein
VNGSLNHQRGLDGRGVFCAVMKRWRVLSAVLLAQAVLVAASSANTAVELVTIGPDRAIDRRFGHILLRVVDPDTQLDESYDFGVAPFHRPDFMARAMMGQAMFRLRRSPARVRFEYYRGQDRHVESQRLDLTEGQIARLLERLAWNLLPENAHYRYDHVLDNCSTRLRDLLDDVTAGAIRAAAAESARDRSFRDDILVAGSGRLVALIGLDLFAGPQGEKITGAWERSFLPGNLHDLVAAAENPAKGAGIPLVVSTTVHQRRSAPSAIGGSVRAGRDVVLALGVSLALLFGASGLAARRAPGSALLLGRLAGLALVPTAAIFGALGVVLLPVAMLSNAAIWAHNQNALLFVPLDLLLLVPAVRWVRTGQASLARWLRRYLDLRLLLIALCAMGVFAPQENTVFAIAVGCAFLGLRTQPARVAR